MSRRRDQGGVAEDERITLDELDPVDTLDDLEITVDDDQDDRERRDSARELDGIVVARYLEAAARSAPVNVRLASLEGWRLEIDRWRLRLTGVDDNNGKLGKLAEAVAELAASLDQAIAAVRADVGDADECRRVRAAADTVDFGKKRAIATVVAAGLALGGVVWTMVKRRDDEVAAATVKRMELELHVRDHDRRIEQLEKRRQP